MTKGAIIFKLFKFEEAIGNTAKGLAVSDVELTQEQLDRLGEQVDSMLEGGTKLLLNLMRVEKH